MKTAGFITVVLLFGLSDAYRHYQDRIPNGDHVPHPCKPNFIWRGVGHMHPLGGGDRNPFGLDFARFKKWNKTICEMDSDNDGLTNGQELGDPSCTWTVGSLPKRTKGITHPGVCDPWGSDKCKLANERITCKTGEFICEGINSPDVFNVTLRFPPTVVPAKETTYMCFTFELDMLEPDVEYHLIASQPYIDNANVMHHSVLTGCGPKSKPMEEPEVCNMAASGCQINLAIWTLGMPGECVYKDAGFKLGRNSITRLNIQHHWTNPELKTDYVDSSGLILYLTKNLRTYDAGYFATGDLHLEIPPGERRVTETSVCSGGCTNKIMKDSVYLMSGWNHMHYLGYEQNVELLRDGKNVLDLTPDTIYSYDNPVVHEYTPLVELKPGDSLKTTCVYRTPSRKRTTFWGEGTFDEMCFGIFTYFPKENIAKQGCLTFDDVEFCHAEGRTMYDCDYAMLFNASHPERMALMSKILDNCNTFGKCRKECIGAIEEVRAHPCFRGKLSKYTEHLFGTGYPSLESVRFLAGIESCECSNSNPPSPSGAAKGTTAVAGLTLLVSIVTVYKAL